MGKRLDERAPSASSASVALSGHGARRFARTQDLAIKARNEGAEIIAHVGAWLSLAYPGLALHRTTLNGRPCIEFGWTISHVGSQTALVKSLPTIADAVQALDELGPLCDWTLSAGEISELPSRDAMIGVCNRILNRVDAGYSLKVGPVSAIARSAT